MAKNTRASNVALRGAKASSFDPTAIIKGFRDEEDRQRKQRREDDELDIKAADRELLIQERRTRIDANKSLIESRKLRRQKDFKDLYGRDADILDPTEFGSVNNVATRAVTGLTNTRNEIVRSMETNNTPEARKELDKIDSSLNKIKLGYDAVKVISDKFVEMEASGTISGMDRANWAEKIQRMKEGKASIQFDANHNPTFVYHDDEGNPTNFDDIQKLINGDIDVIEHYNVPAEMKKLGATVGTVDSTRAKGGSFKGLGRGQKALLEKDVDALVMDDDIVADVLYQMGGNKEGKRDGFSDDERDVVAARLLEQAIGSVSVKTVADDIPKVDKDAIDVTKAPVVPVKVGGKQHTVDLGGDEYRLYNPTSTMNTNDGGIIDEVLFDPITNNVILRGTKTTKFKTVTKEEDLDTVTTTDESGKTVDVIIDNPSEVSNLITKTNNPDTGKSFSSLTEFTEYLKGDEVDAKLEAQRLIDKYRTK